MDEWVGGRAFVLLYVCLPRSGLICWLAGLSASSSSSSTPQQQRHGMVGDWMIINLNNTRVTGYRVYCPWKYKTNGPLKLIRHTMECLTGNFWSSELLKRIWNFRGYSLFPHSCSLATCSPVRIIQFVGSRITFMVQLIKCLAITFHRSCGGRWTCPVGHLLLRLSNTLAPFRGPTAGYFVRVDWPSRGWICWCQLVSVAVHKGTVIYRKAKDEGDSLGKILHWCWNKLALQRADLLRCPVSSILLG